MFPVGGGVMFDMSWALHATTIPTSGGRYLRVFHDVDIVSQNRLPPRHFKLMIFLLNENGHVFDDIDSIPVDEVVAAYAMYVLCDCWYVF